MISDQRKMVVDLIGEKHGDDIRSIIKDIVITRWEIPNVRFSPPMVEHLLYFLAKSYQIINLEFYPSVLFTKFSEEYGYSDYKTLLHKLIEDLIGALRAFCNKEMKVLKIAPRRSMEIVFKDVLLMHLDEYPIDSKSRESISDISGFPVNFLNEFLKCFNSVQVGEPLESEQEKYFGDFLRHMCKEFAL